MVKTLRRSGAKLVKLDFKVKQFHFTSDFYWKVNWVLQMWTFKKFFKMDNYCFFCLWWYALASCGLILHHIQRRTHCLFNNVTNKSTYWFYGKGLVIILILNFEHKGHFSFNRMQGGLQIVEWNIKIKDKISVTVCSISPLFVMPGASHGLST